MLLISDNGSILKRFLDETANMSPDDRVKHLEANKVKKKSNMKAAHDMRSTFKYKGNVSIKLFSVKKRNNLIAVAVRY